MEVHSFSTVLMVTRDISEKPAAAHNLQGRKGENTNCSGHYGNLNKVGGNTKKPSYPLEVRRLISNGDPKGT
jgi:hypothetical protein